MLNLLIHILVKLSDHNRLIPTIFDDISFKFI